MIERRSGLQDIFNRKRISPGMDLGEIAERCASGENRDVWQELFQWAKHEGFQPEELMYWGLSELPLADGEKEGVRFFDPDFRNFSLAVIGHLFMSLEMSGRGWQSVVEHLQFLDYQRVRINLDGNMRPKFKNLARKRVDNTEKLTGFYFEEETETYRAR